MPMLVPEAARFARSASRVRNLLALYDSLGGGRPGRRVVHTTDVLRAATVLLHASLEEFLRSAGNHYLPLAGVAELRTIPLVGRGPRPERFDLGDLVAHRSKSVDVVVKESVAEHLRRSSFNNVGDVKGLLNSCGIQPNVPPRLWTALSEVIDRRHKIVHEGDANPKSGPGQPTARPLKRQTVADWATAVDDLVNAIAAAAP